MTAPSKVRARLLESYARDDLKALNDLRPRLRRSLKIMRDIEISIWLDARQLLGETWRPAILDRLDDCDYGLQFLSPAFFASDFITRYEIPPFVGPAPRKPALPVGLVEFPMDGTAELHGIEELQIFRLDGAFYTQLRGHRKDEFAMTLAQEIRRRLLDDGGWQPL